MTDNWPMRKEISEKAWSEAPYYANNHGRWMYREQVMRWLRGQPDIDPSENPPCSACDYYDTSEGSARCLHHGRAGFYPWGAVPHGRWRPTTSPAPSCFCPKRGARERLVDLLADLAAHKHFEGVNHSSEGWSNYMTMMRREFDAMLPADIGDVDG